MAKLAFFNTENGKITYKYGGIHPIETESTPHQKVRVSEMPTSALSDTAKATKFFKKFVYNK